MTKPILRHLSEGSKQGIREGQKRRWKLWREKFETPEGIAARAATSAAFTLALRIKRRTEFREWRDANPVEHEEFRAKRRARYLITKADQKVTRDARKVRNGQTLRTPLTPERKAWRLLSKKDRRANRTPEEVARNKAQSRARKDRKKAGKNNEQT